MTGPDVSRRAFLHGTCALLTLGMGSALLAEGAQAATGIKKRKDGRVEVSVAKIPELAQVGSAVVLGSVKGIPTALVRTGNRDYRAIDLRCTHAGAAVYAGGPGWACPAHGSQFTLTGTVERGPASAPLRTVKSAWRPKTGTVIVG